MTDGDDERLLDDLAQLITTNGLSDFVHAPILLPTPEFFPDAWRADLRSAEVMLRRLMAHARLSALPFTLRLDTDRSGRPTRSTNGRTKAPPRFLVG